jgi:hypothetical protein
MRRLNGLVAVRAGRYWAGEEPDGSADILQRRLTHIKATGKMQYYIDLPARTAENRRQLGLLTESLIWPIKNTILESTRYSVPRPYSLYILSRDSLVFTIFVEE